MICWRSGTGQLHRACKSGLRDYAQLWQSCSQCGMESPPDACQGDTALEQSKPGVPSIAGGGHASQQRLTIKELISPVGSKKVHCATACEAAQLQAAGTHRTSWLPVRLSVQGSTWLKATRYKLSGGIQAPRCGLAMLTKLTKRQPSHEAHEAQSHQGGQACTWFKART